jgi:hypothetical protein
MTALSSLTANYSDVRRRLYRPSQTQPLAVLVYEPPRIGLATGCHLTGVDGILRPVGFSMDDVRSRRRDPALLSARARVCHYLNDLGWSAARIGQLIERDPTSVFYLLRVRRPDGTQRSEAQT